MTALTLGMISAICWGVHDFAVRYLSQTINLLVAVFATLFAGVVMQSVALMTTGQVTAISPEALPYAVAAGPALAIMGMCLYVAFKRGPVSLVAPIIAGYPIMSMIFAAMAGSSISFLQWIAVLVVLMGITLVAIISEDDQDDSPAKGPTIIYAVAASILLALSFWLGQQATALSEELPVALLSRSVACCFMFFVLLALRLPMWPSLRVWPLIIAMGGLDACAQFALFSAGGMPGAEYAAVASSVFGVITILLAWIFLKEPMKALQWVGCLIAFSGIGYLAI